jgi:RNA polymerase sigma-B factor
VSATVSRLRSPSLETCDPVGRKERALQERLLFSRYRARRDPADREALVRRFLPLAHALAARFRHTHEPFDDLLQVACLGLVNAIDRFDVERSTAFSSYAVPTIVGELKRHFRDRTWPVGVPRDVKELALKVGRTAEQLTSAHGSSPSVADLAHALGVSEEEVLEARCAGVAYEPVSLEVPHPRNDDDTLTDALGRDEDGYARAEQRALLDGLLRFLTLRQREIVRLRFSEDLSQQEIGERVGLSQMQISRILRQAVQRLGEVVVEGSRS